MRYPGDSPRTAGRAPRGSDTKRFINHVASVCADSTIAQSCWKGLKIAGADIPGVISAGTFYHHGKWVFWDVHNPESVIVIDLHDERYEKLIVEVADPADTVTRLQAVLPKV